MRLMQQPCHWCHTAPSPYNGLDRLDNEPRYSVRNVVPCCKRCNRAKCTMTAMEFVRWCAVVVMNRYSAVRDGQHLRANVVPTKDGFAVVKNVYGKVGIISAHATEDEAYWAAFKHDFNARHAPAHRNRGTTNRQTETVLWWD